LPSFWNTFRKWGLILNLLLSIAKSLLLKTKRSQRPRPSGRGLKKGNNSLAASIPTLLGGALKGGGKKTEPGYFLKILISFGRYIS